MKLATLLFLSVGTALAGPCITPTPACTDWVTLGGGPWRSMVYTTYPLSTPNPQISRAFVMIHGTNRDADNYFRTSLASAFLGGALDDTIVIAPRIGSSAGSCHDALAANEVSWSCSGDSWRSGGTSASTDKLTSFDFVDEILRKLARRDAFPNLKAIVVAGHSAGGQYVNRYSMANQVHDTLGVPVTYIVSNPSSYAWPDATRPNADASAFVEFDGSRCANFNRWPYGIQNRTGGYTAKMSDDQLKKQLAARPITYLLSELDTLPLAGFDSSCSAMAQGPSRFARGQAFTKFVAQKLGAKPNTVVVPLCGHNARCVFTSDIALPLAFPK